MNRGIEKCFFSATRGPPKSLGRSCVEAESTTVKVIGIRVSTEIQREIILHLKKKNIHQNLSPGYMFVFCLFSLRNRPVRSDCFPVFSGYRVEKFYMKLIFF